MWKAFFLIVLFAGCERSSEQITSPSLTEARIREIVREELNKINPSAIQNIHLDNESSDNQKIHEEYVPIRPTTYDLPNATPEQIKEMLANDEIALSTDKEKIKRIMHFENEEKQAVEEHPLATDDKIKKQPEKINNDSKERKH